MQFLRSLKIVYMQCHTTFHVGQNSLYMFHMWGDKTTDMQFPTK